MTEILVVKRNGIKEPFSEDRFLNNLESIIIRLENRGQITAFAKEYLLKKIGILKNS